MKKKWKWIIAIIALLLCFQACGSKPAKTKNPAAPAPTAAQTEPAHTFPVIQDTEFYSGTWKIAGINTKGVDFTLEQAVAMGGSNLKDVYLVLSSDGTAYLFEGKDVVTSPWSAQENGIQVGNANFSYSDNLLKVESNGEIVYLEKVSNDQTPPKSVAAETTEPAATETTVPETTAPQVPETTVPAASAGIRPEFREAMDSYEAFYNEYCDLMEKYSKNPTDVSLLGKYAGMLTKAEEMDKKFSAWDEGEMTSEELKYYLDVTSRVQKRMIDLF